MALSDDFYTCLIDIFHQVTLDPDRLPIIPLTQWPAGSPEGQILLEIQTALTRLELNNDHQLGATEQKWLLYKSVFESNCNGVIIYDIGTGQIIETNSTVSLMLGYDHQEIVALPINIFIHSDSSPAWSSCIETVQNGGVYNGKINLVRRDRSKAEIDLSATKVTYQDRSCVLAITRDLNEVGEQNNIENMLQQGVSVRTHELSTLLDISQTLSLTLDIDPELILDQLRKIIAYTQACLFTVEESTLVALAIRGPKQVENLIPMEIRMDGPEILNILFNAHKPIRIADLCSSEPTAIFLRSLMKNQAEVLLEGFHSWMWVPLAVKDRILGGMGIAHEQPNYFTRHHADLALTVANQAAITMANAELYENARMYAVLQERERLARSLHDAVNQSLFSASLIADVLPRLWEQNQEDARHSLEDLRRLTSGAMAEMRMMMSELKPMALTDASIHDVLCLLSEAFAGRTSIPVKITVMGEFAFPSDVQIVFYRLCQEGLNNIGKHAQATQAEITLKYVDEFVNLLIYDNGRGFDPGKIPGGHYGLKMMKERAESIGATIDIHSRIGIGTTIDIRWAKNPDWKKYVE